MSYNKYYVDEIYQAISSRHLAAGAAGRWFDARHRRYRERRSRL